MCWPSSSVVPGSRGMRVSLCNAFDFIQYGFDWIFVSNPLASLNFFKTFGYVTCAHALAFTHDLKLGHYCKIPPRQTFVAQIVATIVSTFVCISILNFQMNKIDRVCEVDQPDHYTCPGVALVRDLFLGFFFFFFFLGITS